MALDALKYKGKSDARFKNAACGIFSFLRKPTPGLPIAWGEMVRGKRAKVKPGPLPNTHKTPE